MRKNQLFILGLMLILSACASNVPLTFPDKFDKVIVADFSFRVEDLTPPENGDGGRLNVLSILKAKEIIHDIKESLKDTLGPPPYKAYTDSIYFIILDSLKNGLHIPILTPQEDGNEIRDAIFGYHPDNADTAIRKGSFDAALDIWVTVTYPTTDTSRSSLFGIAKTKVKGKPMLTLKVKMIDNSEKILWRDCIKVKSNEWMLVDDKRIWGIQYKQEYTGPSVVDLTRQAVHLLIDKNKNL